MPKNFWPEQSASGTSYFVEEGGRRGPSCSTPAEAAAAFRERNWAVKEARSLAARPDAGAYERRKADELLDQAAKQDAALESYRRGRREGVRLTTRTPDGKVLWGGRVVRLPAGSNEAKRLSESYQDAFREYLHTGHRGDAERLGLQTVDDSKGGYAVPVPFAAQVAGHLGDTVSVRRAGATVIPVMAGKGLRAVSWDSDFAPCDWTAEVPASDIAEDDNATFGGREMTLHVMTRMVKVSVALLRNSALDMEAFIGERLSNRAAMTEEDAFLNGDGTNKPLGLYYPSDAGVPTSQDTTAEGTTAFTGDDLWKTLLSLRERYVRAATWILHRETLKRARLLHDGEGQYLWAAGLGGAPDTLCDRPYELSEFAPCTFTTGKYVAVVGDLSCYWVADGLDTELQVLNELFRLKNQWGFILYRRVDGMPATGVGFRRLKLA